MPAGVHVQPVPTDVSSLCPVRLIASAHGQRTCAGSAGQGGAPSTPARSCDAFCSPSPLQRATGGHPRCAARAARGAARFVQEAIALGLQ